jgi:hypothetical protein
MKLNFNNFTSHLIFHPFDAATKKDRVIALVISIATVIFSLGLVHAACLIKRCIYPVNVEIKFKRLLKDLRDVTLIALQHLKIESQSVKADFDSLINKANENNALEIGDGLTQLFRKYNVTNWITEDAEAIAHYGNLFRMEVTRLEKNRVAELEAAKAKLEKKQIESYSTVQVLMNNLLSEILIALDQVTHPAGKVFFLKKLGEPFLADEKYPEKLEAFKNNAKGAIASVDEKKSDWVEDTCNFYNIMFVMDKLLDVKGAVTPEMRQRIEAAQKALGDYCWKHTKWKK